jgi:hypothetical protein
VYAAFGLVSSLLLVADRSPEGLVVPADAMLANVRTAISALPARGGDESVDVEVTACPAEFGLMRPDPITWQVHASTERAVTPSSSVQVDWWRDNVNRELDTDGFATDLIGLRIAMPSDDDRRSVDITTDCIVGSDAQQDAAIRELTSLAARIVAVEARPRELSELTAELERAAAKAPETRRSDGTPAPTVSVEACDGAETSPAAYRITGSVEKDAGTSPSDDRRWLKTIVELFDIDPIMMQFAPGFGGDGYFTSLDFVDGSIMVSVETDCAIGDERAQTAAREAGADLLLRIIALHGTDA